MRATALSAALSRQSGVRYATYSSRILCLHPENRQYSTTVPRAAQSEPATASLSPRWLSDVKRRIGQCILFGLTSAQKTEAGQVLQELALDWRELVAGSEGFLTEKGRRSMFRHPVVWGEMDSMGHVNNVVYPRYAETGRINWLQNTARYVDPDNAKAWLELGTPRGEGLILRKITIEFKFPMTHPDHVTVYHKFNREPRQGMDTFDFDVLMLSELHQRPVARCVEDCVLYDYRQGKRTPLRPFMLEVLQQTWKLQEEAKQANGERVKSLLDRVRRLEVESWDRPDAVEDKGSAS